MGEREGEEDAIWKTFTAAYGGGGGGNRDWGQRIIKRFSLYFVQLKAFYCALESDFRPRGGGSTAHENLRND